MDNVVASMTGYGKSLKNTAVGKVSVEIKSVNNRYSDISIKLPRHIGALEDKIRKRMMGAVARGKIDVFVNIENIGASDSTIKINWAMANLYRLRLREISLAYELRPSDDKQLELISRANGVIEADRNADEADADEIWVAISPVIEEAVLQFLEMRAREGFILQKDLLARLEHAKNLALQINDAIPQIQAAHHQKLRARMQEILKDTAIDENRLLNEAAYQAERAAVDEELLRLSSHIDQFCEVLKNGGGVGKKLDFIIQELIRETNTIGSKCNDISISKIVIELKSEIEKIREQIQNLE
ncbi:MAG: YicC family protein [Defluviitaleaceae bacterium]|nr:YicC family protein [Defluviitaleaceae bacterium]